MSNSHPEEKLSAEPLDSDRGRWLDLLNRVDSAAIVDHFMDELRQQADYANPIMPLSEIRRTAVESFAALLSGLATNDRSEFQSIASHVGITRARAGVPMVSLFAAVRLDFTVLWHELMRQAEPGDEGVLLRHANFVWQFVDDYSRAVQREYQAEEQRRINSEALAIRGLLTELFGQQKLTRARIEAIAERLRIPVDGEFLVTVAAGSSMPPLQTLVSELERNDILAFTLYGEGQLILFTHRRLGSVPDSLLAKLHALPVGLVGHIHGLENVRSAYALASQLAELAAADADRAVTPDNGWGRILRQHLEHEQLSIRERIDHALRDCGPAERRNLKEAVRVYLRTGSVSVVAAETFCHRNTVTNRLQRFTKLTGVDVTVPEQAARVVISWA